MKVPLAIGAVALLAACAGPQAVATPAPSQSTTVASPSASVSAAPSVSATPSSSATAIVGAGAQIRCTASMPVNHALAIVLLSGSTTPVLADVSDPAHPTTLCTIGGQALNPHFVSATELSYATTNPGGPGSLVTVDLLSGSTGTVASWTGDAFASGTYAWSPDGSTLAYITSTVSAVEWHIVAHEDDRTIATLPPVAGRGVSPDSDSLTLAFSPDGKYVALVQTFTGGSTSADAPFQVRKSDGSLVNGGPSGRTMAAWSGTGSTLYFRDQSGVERWIAPANVSAVLPSVLWIRPRASVDGRWMAFTQRDHTGLPSAELLDLTNSSAARAMAAGAAEPSFLTATSVWFRQERLCQASDNCEMGPPSVPTGAAFLYNVLTGKTTPSTITSVLDTWTPAAH